MRNKIGCCIILALVQLFSAAILQAQQIKLGELELIYTEDEIPIRYDGSLSTIRKNGEMHFFHSFGCRLKTSPERRSRHSWHKGSPDDPLKCHVVSKTDKVFFYFNDVVPGGSATQRNRIQCVARAELDAVIKAAAQHKVTPWHKYRDGKWDVPGLSTKPGEDLIPHVTGGEDLHADAAYCTALGKYLLTVQTHRASKLLLFSSPDGLDWSLATIVDQTSKKVLQPYSSFVDFDGPSADCHVVDHDFFLYFPRKGPDSNTDYLYRRRITIEGANQ